jgi:hypothetical protein
VSGRCTPTEALKLLRRGGFSPRAAARELTTGIHDPDVCRLWADSVLVPVNFVDRLKVVVRLEDGRWTADIVSAVNEAWDRPVYKQIFELEIVEGIEVYGELVHRDVLKTITVEPPYQWELDVDEVVALLPVRRGKKGANWEIHATLEMERLGRKAALDLHNSGQLLPRLKDFLQREIKFVPKDDRALPSVITAFLRGAN